MTTTTRDFNSPTGTAVGFPDGGERPTRTIADLVEDVGSLKNRTRLLVEDSSQLYEDSQQLHDETLIQLLRTRTGERAKQGIDSLLAEVSRLGFSWRDVARVVGVTVPAVRKWRAGEQPVGENRRRLAEFVAFCDIVSEQYLISEIASWLEVPLVQQAPVSGLDFLADGRVDLLFRWASDSGADPEELLTEFDSGWRDRYASDIEVFKASDGQKGLRLKTDQGR